MSKSIEQEKLTNIAKNSGYMHALQFLGKMCEPQREVVEINFTTNKEEDVSGWGIVFNRRFHRGFSAMTKKFSLEFAARAVFEELEEADFVDYPVISQLTTVKEKFLNVLENSNALAALEYLAKAMDYGPLITTIDGKKLGCVQVSLRLEALGKSVSYIGTKADALNEAAKVLLGLDFEPVAPEFMHLKTDPRTATLSLEGNFRNPILLGDKFANNQVMHLFTKPLSMRSYKALGLSLTVDSKEGLCSVPTGVLFQVVLIKGQDETLIYEESVSNGKSGEIGLFNYTEDKEISLKDDSIGGSMVMVLLKKEDDCKFAGIDVSVALDFIMATESFQEEKGVVPFIPIGPFFGQTVEGQTMVLEKADKEEVVETFPCFPNQLPSFSKSVTLTLDKGVALASHQFVIPTPPNSTYNGAQVSYTYVGREGFSGSAELMDLVVYTNSVPIRDLTDEFLPFVEVRPEGTFFTRRFGNRLGLNKGIAEKQNDMYVTLKQNLSTRFLIITFSRDCERCQFQSEISLSVTFIRTDSSYPEAAGEVPMRGVGVFQVQVVPPPLPLEKQASKVQPVCPIFEEDKSGYSQEQLDMIQEMGGSPSKIVGRVTCWSKQMEVADDRIVTVGGEGMFEGPPSKVETAEPGLTHFMETDMEEGNFITPTSDRAFMESLPLDQEAHQMGAKIRIGTFPVPTAADAEVFRLVFPGDYFDLVPQLIWRLTNIAAIKFDLEVICEVISQPTVAGIALLWASPGARIPSDSGEILTGLHRRINLGTKAGCAMNITYMRDQLAMLGDGYRSENRSKEFNWAVVGCTTLSGKNPMDSEASIAVYFQLCNIKVATGGLTSFPVPALQTARKPRAAEEFRYELEKQMVRRAKRRAQQGLNAIDEAEKMTGDVMAGAKKGIKTVGNIIKTTGPLLLGAAQMAALSKEDSVSFGERQTPQWMAPLCHTVGVDTGHSLTVYPNAITLPNPKVFNDVQEGDPMDLNLQCKRKGLYSRFLYQTGTATDTVIYATNVGIGCSARDNAGNVKPSVASFVGSHFGFWRADIIYTFVVSKTAFHNGNLRVIVQYGSEEVPDSAAVASIPYSTVWDLSKRSVLEVEVPYFHKYHWRKFRHISEGDAPTFNMPRLSIVANSSLTANDAVAPVIEILVMMHAENVSFVQPQGSLAVRLDTTALEQPKPKEPVKIKMFSKQAAHDAVDVLAAERVVLGKKLGVMSLDELSARSVAGQVITSGAHLLRRSLPVGNITGLPFLTYSDAWDLNSPSQGIGPFLDVFTRLWTHAVGGWRLKFVTLDTAGPSIFEIRTKMQGKQSGLLGQAVAVTTSYAFPVLEVTIARDMPQSVWLLGKDENGLYQRGRSEIEAFSGFTAARVYVSGADDLRAFGQNYLGKFSITGQWDNTDVENYALPVSPSDN